MLYRTTRVATSSLAIMENGVPPGNVRQPDPAQTLQLGLSILEAAGRQKADLACLPEGFAAAGLPTTYLHEVAEPLSGPIIAAVADCARRYAMYVVAGFYVLDEGRVLNIAALIDRSGRLVGSYAKRHPTEGEIDGGITPGTAARVFDTEIGRIGLAICFDLNWPMLWQELHEQRADLVCWLSAYEGGMPLQARALTYGYPIVTSVWLYHARIIERTGRVAVQTSRWSRLVTHDLNPAKRLFHTDGQWQHLLPIQTRYGDRVRVEAFTEEHLFTLESLVPDLDVDDIVTAYGLIEYDAYIARAAEAQAAARESRRLAGLRELTI
jgi:predicted amidohydrolase